MKVLQFIADAMKSWKSTLIGVASLFLAAMATYHDATWMDALKDMRVQMAVAVGILGLVTKDSNVTGGTTGQPSTPAALHEANQAPSVANPPKEEPK